MCGIRVDKKLKIVMKVCILFCKFGCNFNVCIFCCLFVGCNEGMLIIDILFMLKLCIVVFLL